MLALKQVMAVLPGYFWKRPGSAGALPFWRRLAVQAEIHAVITGGQYLFSAGTAQGMPDRRRSVRSVPQRSAAPDREYRSASVPA